MVDWRLTFSLTHSTLIIILVELIEFLEVLVSFLKVEISLNAQPYLSLVTKVMLDHLYQDEFRFNKKLTSIVLVLW